MNKTQVKFCGLKTLEDVKASIACGVDAVGFVFVPKSPRCVSIQEAMPLIKAVQRADVTAVALFANQEASFIAEVIRAIEPGVVQFHGDEDADFCQQFDQPYWKAVPMLAVSDYEAYMKQYPSADAFLLDAYGQQQSGGSGKTFDWFELPDRWRDLIILAGGIDADNVQSALLTTGAKYIDTSSGIETSPGVKSLPKMKLLMDQIRSFDEERIITKKSINPQ